MAKTAPNGLSIDRYFSDPLGDPYEDPNGILDYSSRDVIVKNNDGEIVEEFKSQIFPGFWTQNAINTVTTKYFRKKDIPEEYIFGGRETDIRQLVGRVAKKISQWGVEQGHFSASQYRNFEHELVAATLFQYGAFNSPIWFNVGLDLHGVNKKEDGFYVDGGRVRRPKNWYEHPQGPACFISSPEDSIESMTYIGATISSRIFKGGSGIGGDWSKVRSAGESVSGGGVASGAKRFMDVQDTEARVIKSGGKTRRAAVNQSIAVWHPDMLDIIRDKYAEEQKARVLIEAGSPKNWENHTIQNLRGQNVNINIRVNDEFWRAYENGGDYAIRRVIDGGIVREEPASKLASLIAFANHGCGDPNMQFHDTINLWNTCKESGEIEGTNPCSEFNWLNDSACNLASLNLMRFRRSDGSFDLPSFNKAVDLYITAQDAIVTGSSYPSKEIAVNSNMFRPLGLGYANLGAYIMSLGLPYDSDEAREFAAAVTSNLTAEAYLQSARLAEVLGPFQEFEKNKESMLEVMEMHRKASKGIPKINGIEELVDSANAKWDETIEMGEIHGYRNAQATLLAPTGTIGFMMGCDTTGCEPEYQLKKYKELAGGGFMKIVNGTVPLALEVLGYAKDKINQIKQYIWENETVEGCELLNRDHLPVFDCAVVSGKGTRSIEPMGHIRMLGAIQPHLSGAISKTVNAPSNTSVEEIESMFYQAWNLGVKAVAIYRDGAKAAQPLTTRKDGELEILSRGDREHLRPKRQGITEKVKIGNISFFIRTGEYEDGRLGELFIDSMQRGSDTNRLLNQNAIQFSEKLQYGVSVRDALEVFVKAGQSQIAGMTTHPFIKTVSSPEEFLHQWISAHYLGDISSVPTGDERRPLPEELRVYEQVPKLHLMPTVEGEKMYPDVPSLEETIKKISRTNYWLDKEDGLDTRETIEKIKRTRAWKNENTVDEAPGKMTGRTCDKGHLMVNDGSCWKCPICKTSTGGCGGG